MDIFKNFIHSLKRYKAAMLLNLFGLTIAFASFIIIMTQVRYDLTFDHHYRHKDRIYRLENQVMSDDGTYGVGTSRPCANKIFGQLPGIEKAGLITPTWYEEYPVYDSEKGKASLQGPFSEYVVELGALDVLEFECLYGSPDRIAEPNTVILSQGVAKALYGQENPIGRSVVYGSDTLKPREIIAVYKDFPKNSLVKNNAMIRFIGDRDLDRPGNWKYMYFVRLAPNADLIKLHQSMAEIYKEFSGADSVKPDFFRLNPIAGLHFAQDVSFDGIEKGNRTTVYSLIAVALLIVLIAMINFVNFATSLVPVRIRSINTQKVLGGTNGAIRRNLIAEPVGIALLSFAASLLVVQFFSSTSWASLISTSIRIGSDMEILAGTGLVALGAGLLAGIYPAFYSTSFAPALVLKGSFGLSPRGRALRTGLISVQFVISIVLIIVAVSVYLQNRYMQRFDMGFQRDNILTTWIPEQAVEQKDALVGLLKSNPAVMDVTFTAGPLVAKDQPRWGRGYKGKNILFNVYAADWNFLSFMGLKIVEGRDFTEEDNRKETASHIFNQAAQRRDSIAVGEEVNGAEIVGIVQDFNFRPLQFNIDPLGIYLPGKNDWGFRHMLVKIRTSDLPGTIGYIRETLRKFDPDARPEVTFLDESIGQLYQKEQNLSRLILLFSLLAVLISIIGTFGLILFETQHRRKEVGVRKAFGSTVGEILRMFNKGFVRIVLVCFVVASPIAYYIVKKWLENFAYQMPVAIWVFVVALLAVLLITVVTITVQSYRTATENPLESIKTE